MPEENEKTKIGEITSEELSPMKPLSTQPEGRSPVPQETCLEVRTKLEPTAQPRGVAAKPDDDFGDTVTIDASLITVAAKEQPKLLPLTAGFKEIFLTKGTLRVGRSGNVDIHIPDPSISRPHALIEWKNDGFSVTDLQSKNGVWVNGRKVEHAVLKHGDIIMFGAVKYEFRERQTDGPLPATAPRTAVGVNKLRIALICAVALAGLFCAAYVLGYLDKPAAPPSKAAAPAPVKRSTSPELENARDYMRRGQYDMAYERVEIAERDESLEEKSRAEAREIRGVLEFLLPLNAAWEEAEQSRPTNGNIEDLERSISNYEKVKNRLDAAGTDVLRTAERFTMKHRLIREKTNEILEQLTQSLELRKKIKNLADRAAKAHNAGALENELHLLEELVKLEQTEFKSRHTNLTRLLAAKKLLEEKVPSLLKAGKVDQARDSLDTAEKDLAAIDKSDPHHKRAAEILTDTIPTAKRVLIAVERARSCYRNGRLEETIPILQQEDQGNDVIRSLLSRFERFLSQLQEANKLRTEGRFPEVIEKVSALIDNVENSADPDDQSFCQFLEKMLGELREAYVASVSQRLTHLRKQWKDYNRNGGLIDSNLWENLEQDAAFAGKASILSEIQRDLQDLLSQRDRMKALAPLPEAVRTDLENLSNVVTGEVNLLCEKLVSTAEWLYTNPSRDIDLQARGEKLLRRAVRHFPANTWSKRGRKLLEGEKK